jgi:8-oxo-dGTP diphosphatase
MWEKLIMNVKSNVIIFSTDNKERTDVRRLKEKKLQIALDNKNSLPIFDINNKEDMKTMVCNNLKEMFGNTKFYIEQLYTWGDPQYYNEESELIVTYLVIVNREQIENETLPLEFYDITIENLEGEKRIQNVILESENQTIEYEIETLMKKEKNSVEYINKLVGTPKISELTSIIIHTGIKRLRNRIENTNIAFSFLLEEFTISELQQVYEIILDKKLVAANFRKKIDPMIKKTEKVVKESAFRPSNKYTFNEEFLEYWV